MSDALPPRGENPSVLPSPASFDPGHEQQNFPPEPTGPVVLLLAGEASREWKVSSALELCAAWARSGRRIVLADLHLEDPVLHEVIGEEDCEGMVDVFFYGASISRSARPVPGRGFYLIPAGTYTSDAQEVYRHERWPKLVAGFRDSSASLVLFVPTGADVGALSQWASEAYLLGERGSTDPLRTLSEAGVPSRAHLIPPRADATRAARGSRPSAVVHPGEDPGLHLPPPPVRTRRGGRSITFALWLALTVIVLMAIGSVVGRLRPDLLPWLGAPAPGSDPAEQSGVAPAPRSTGPAQAPAGQALPFSVQVSAFSTLSAAFERLASARETLIDAPLFVSPEEIDGIVYYKVLAGALPDSASARRLRDDLVAQGLLTPQDATGSMTVFQSAPLAFGLSAYPDEGSARLAADSLLDRNISAYAVPLPPNGQASRWQLYAGAYRDSAAAEVMRTMLASAGVSPQLVARSGIPATESE